MDAIADMEKGQPGPEDLPEKMSMSTDVALAEDALGQAPMDKRSDGEFVWDTSDNPGNPYNWSSMRKISIIMVYSVGQLITLSTASVMAPAMNKIAIDVGMTTAAVQLAFSAFFLGLGVGPFIAAPLAEMYGRRPVWLIGNALFVLWNALCPVGHTQALLIIGRLVSSLGCSVGVTLMTPATADMYRAHERGRSMALAGLLPYLGPALGPIIGGLVSDHVSWPWLFWILSIAEGAVFTAGFFLLKETYAPVLIKNRRKRHHIDRSMPTQSSHPIADPNSALQASFRDLCRRLATSLSRPIKLLLTRPVIQLYAFCWGLDFAIYCLLLSTFATLWIDRYGQTQTQSSLHYIAISLGCCLSSQGGGRLMDLVFRVLRARSPDNPPIPEFRVPVMALGALLMPAGALWYGWAAQAGAHWAVVDVGVLVFTCGDFLYGQAMWAYLLDEFTSHAASAGAAGRILAYVLGFAFPIFGPALYARLEYGWGNTLLALLFVGLGWPPVAVFWFWGGRLRAVGRRERRV